MITSRAYGLLLTIAGAVGLAASFVLTLEKIRLLENPNYVPSCNLNPVISCGSVMRTSQASVFGFANSLIGVVAFAVVVTVGVSALAGARFPRWFWLGMQAGTVFGIVFVHWLMFQTLYRVGAVCPYCIAVWIVVILLFVYTTRFNLANRRERPEGSAPSPLAGLHWLLPVAWYVLIGLLILNRFWYFWKTQL